MEKWSRIGNPCTLSDNRLAYRPERKENLETHYGNLQTESNEKGTKD